MHTSWYPSYKFNSPNIYLSSCISFHHCFSHKHNKLLVSFRSLKFFSPIHSFFISFLPRALFKHLSAYQICFYLSLCSKHTATNKRLIKRHFHSPWTNSINSFMAIINLVFHHPYSFSCSLGLKWFTMWNNNYCIWTLWADISVTSFHPSLSVYQ